MADQELETLFVDFIGRDDKLEALYQRIVDRARQKAEEVGKAFQQGMGQTTGTALEESAKRQEKALEDVYRAITALTEALGKTRTRQKETGKETDELREAFEKLRNESAGLRNAVESGAVSVQDAIQDFQRLQNAALANADGLERTSNEWRQFMQVAGQAARSVATLEGRTTKLGFSANNAVGVTQALRMHMDFLGQGGGAAAKALGIAEIALGGFMLKGAEGVPVLQRLGFGLRQLAAVMPVIVAGVTVAATAALFRMGQAAADAADQVDKAAQSAGFSAEAFQEVAFALEQSGVSIDQTRQGLNDFNARLGQAANGTKSIVEAYERLGVAIRDANGDIRSSEAVFTDLIGSLSAIPSAAQQAAIGGLVFGEEFSRRVIPALNQGAEGFAELRNQARELGLVMSGDAVRTLVQFKDELNILKRQFETAKIEIVAGFIPVFTNFLMPLIQNQLVPLLQTAAERVQEFAQKFLDASPAGAEFRANMLANIQPLLSFGDVIVGVGQGFLAFMNLVLAGAAGIGAALGTLSVQAEQFAAGLANLSEGMAWWQQGNFLGAIEALKRMRNLATNVFDAGEIARAVDDATRVYVTRAEQLATEGQERLARGLSGDYSDAFEGLANSLRTAVESGAASLPAALRDAVDEANAQGALAGLEVAPEGSLAAWREQLTAARKEFETAITDEARAAALERIGIIEAEIQQIEALLRAEDPLEPARVWLGRLSEELRFGEKTAQEVYDIVSPTVERLREEGRAALQEFGWDSQQYRDTVAKLEFVEGFLQRVIQSDPTLQVRLDTSRVENDLQESLRALQQRFSGDAGLTFTVQAVERTEGRFGSLEEAFVGLARAGITITGPMLEFLTERFGETEAAVDRAKAAMAELRQAELERLREIQATRFTGEAALVFTVQGVERTQGQFESLEDAISKLSRAGVVLTAPMLELLTERFKQAETGADRLKEALIEVQQAQLQRLRDALTSRFTDTNGLTFTVQAVERTAGAFTSVEDAMRKFADAGVVVTGPMLEYLAERFEGVSQGAETTGDAIRRIVDEELPRRLAAAAASAALFGTQTELAAQSASILEAAIERILLLDPEADVTAQMQAWKAWRLEIGKGKGEATDLSGVLRDLEAAQERLAQLTGDAPTEWDNLRAAFQAAADAAVITREELEKFLEVLEKLEQASESARALNELAGNIDIGTQIATGLTSALEGIRDGDVNSVLSGLTDIGVAIGTAIGGPAVGAIVGAIGQAVQALPSLFQAISDLFTGDSPARRKLAASLTQTIEGAVRSGIDAGLRGADDWREQLRSGIRESVVGALVDAFIEAAVTQAIIAPFVDEFTRILNRQGRDAALAFLEANLNGILSAAEVAAAGIVRIFDRYFDDIEDPARGVDPFNPGTFELPDATVSVLAAPQWALELTTAVGTISLAGEAMLEAATMMQATFQAGITVNNQSTRGIDAQRAAL